MLFKHRNCVQTNQAHMFSFKFDKRVVYILLFLKMVLRQKLIFKEKPLLVWGPKEYNKPATSLTVLVYSFKHHKQSQNCFEIRKTPKMVSSYNLHPSSLPPSISTLSMGLWTLHSAILCILKRLILLLLFTPEWD